MSSLNFVDTGRPPEKVTALALDTRTGQSVGPDDRQSFIAPPPNKLHCNRTSCSEARAIILHGIVRLNVAFFRPFTLQAVLEQAILNRIERLEYADTFDQCPLVDGIVLQFATLPASHARHSLVFLKLRRSRRTLDCRAYPGCRLHRRSCNTGRVFSSRNHSRR